MRTAVGVVIVALSLLAPAPQAWAQESTARRALAPFFEASDAAARRALVPEILATTRDAGALFDALRAGPSLPVDPPTGRIRRARAAPGRTYRWFAEVPQSYDARRAYPVRFYLHGGVSRGEPADDDSWWQRPERVSGEGHISVFPSSWRDALWWTAAQVDNLHAILDELKRSYNVDEDRVSVTGVSDGGTGAYFLAFRDATPWAAFLPFIGHAGVLLNPAVGADGPFSVVNVANKPLYVVNGTDDRLYPVRAVEPFVSAFRAVGAELVWRPQEGGGHDTRWWPDEAEGIERFLVAHPRAPYPEHIVWETDRTDRYARAHWIVIDELGHVPAEASFIDPVVLEDPGEAGRVVATRMGNRISVRTRGVRRFRVLLSPDVFDFVQPVVVEVNGAVVHEAVVEPDADSLLRFAAEDFDRRQLYLAEISVDLVGR